MFRKMAVMMMAVVPVLAFSVPSYAGPPQVDFVFMDETQPSPDNTGMECGARLNANYDRAGPFVVHINMTALPAGNGGSDGAFYVQYEDDDWVKFFILKNTSVALTIDAGLRVGVDTYLRVKGDGSGGSLLSGIMTFRNLGPKLQKHANISGGPFCENLPTTDNAVKPTRSR